MKSLRRWVALSLGCVCLGSLALGQETRGLLREMFADIQGTTLADLTNNPAYPYSPTSESIVTDFFETPTDSADYYGQRLRTLIVPPTTGNYTFWIASDDAGGLYLSTDDNPANIRTIAWVNGWTSARAWDWEPNQKSAAIPLEGGRSYYLEALHKEGGGGDNLAVRWQLPDGSIEEPIPASRLLVYGLGAPSIVQPPRSLAVAEGERATFTVQANRLLGTTLQWQKNGVNVSGATNTVYVTDPVTLDDNGAEFRCGVTNAQGGVLSAAAILTVNPDRTPPTIASVMSLGDPRVLAILFSEPVEAASALVLDHYSIDRGVTVEAAQFAGDTRTVVLRTSPLGNDTEYTLTVSNVRDRAATPNTSVAGTHYTFRLALSPLDIAAVYPSPEPLGPSNRRWGVVVSEIMYHPAVRADGRNAQYLELFNTFDWPQDLSGWRLSGDVDYVFPANTILPKRGFLVVAPVPADCGAVYTGVSALGGFDALPKEKGLIRLRNDNGGIVFETEYSNRPPYPTAAGGAGHSLVLARPSYGEGQVEAWAASERVGGSPGIAEPVRDTAYRTVLLNEVLTHTDEPQVDFVELYNYGAQPVDLSGCIVTDDPATNRFVVPAGTTVPALGFVVFDQRQLGFALSASGESVFLFTPDRARVVDALAFGAQANGVAYGRLPDGAPTFAVLDRPTPGSANGGRQSPAVVINEIMYKPISRDRDDEYVELFNPGATTIDVSGWKFTDGIDFQFAAGSAIPAGGYLVVARNRERLLANYSQLNAANTVGNYQGSLANAGERLALAMPHPEIVTNSRSQLATNWAYVVVNEVSWRKGGRWPDSANGAGSSLELIDPRADNRWAGNWAGSDESAKSEWTTIETTGVLDNGNGGYPPNQLQVFLLGRGECLIDNVEVVRSGGANLVANPSFTAGLAGWVPQGNHSGSAIDTGAGLENGPCLRVRAAGRGDPGANRIRTAISGLASGNTATLRARVRWVSGWPEILLRLRGNWLEAAGTLQVPRNLGTPGLANSRRVANAAPAFADVTHEPALPAAGQAVTVRTRVNDADGLASLVLYYRVDPATNYTGVGMTYRGAGYYSATLPGQVAKGQIAYYLQASDLNSTVGVSRFPSDAPGRECLIQFGEAKAKGNFGTYRLWMADRTLKQWIAREKLNNAPLDCTFVYGDSRVVYNVGALYGGSPFLSPSYNSPLGSLCGYVFVFPEDDRCLNVTDFTMDYPARDGTVQLEHVALWMLDRLGVHGGYRRFVNLFINGNRRGTIYEDCLQPNGDLIEAQFPSDADGDLYKIDDWFEFDDAASSFSNVDATLQKFTTTGNVKKTARYRWNWRKRAVARSASDYSTLFALVDAVNPRNEARFTDAEYAILDRLVDLDHWVRVFAVERIAANWDSYGYSRGKNMLAYKPQAGKWVLWPWDIDFVFDTSGRAATEGLFGSSDPTMSRLLNHAPARRLYLQALKEAAEGPMVAATVAERMDAFAAGLKANGISVGGTTGSKNWIAQRRDFILSQLQAYEASFAITSNGGVDLTTGATTLALTGTAPLGVYRLLLNGIEYPLTWTSPTSWSALVALQPGRNVLNVTGCDRAGIALAGAQASLAVQCTAAAEDPADFLAINEIMYHPPVAGAGFVEIYNRSASTTYDLSRWLIKGADFAFPDGTLLKPQGLVLAVEDPVVFAATYGASLPVAGKYAGKLDHDGETLRLVKPGASPAEDATIDEVDYLDRVPWPSAADGFGPSLQLIDPTLKYRWVGNWAAADTNASVLATPGAMNSVRAALPAFPSVWINEVLPRNLGGAADTAGEFDPWIELYNAGATPVDLSDLFLSDDYRQPAAWAFPAGATIQPGQYLVVWADGQPGQQTAAEWHSSFRLAADSGAVFLSRLQGGVPTVFDGFSYRDLAAGRSYGPYPEGQAKAQRFFDYPTPGAANNPAYPPLPVRINEWMASNTGTLIDPLTQKFEDWFELYNGGATPVDLGGYVLSDSLTNTTGFVIPAGTTVPAFSPLLVWADGANEVSNNVLHVSFKLSAAGETIALFTPDGTVVDSVAFGAQTADVSQGRLPDGQNPPFVSFEIPTPGAPNSGETPNHPPLVARIPSQRVFEGETLRWVVSATDPDAGQTLTFGLETGAPAGASIDPSSGVLTWTPASPQVPGSYTLTIRVTDNGVPPQSGSTTLLVEVFKLNHAPVLAAPGDVTMVEGTPLQLSLLATDADADQRLTYAAVSALPAGMTLSPDTGVVAWTPSETQGPGVYSLTFRVSDNGLPSLSHTQSLTLSVTESNQAPVWGTIPDATVTAEALFRYALPASDPDSPTNQLTFRFGGSVPEGMTLHPDSGILSWTPTAAQAPATHRVTVIVEDNGSPSLSATQTFTLKVEERPLWQYVSVTGTGSSSTLYLYLLAAGDVYLDDLQLVQGRTAGVGTNLLANGDFEKALTNGWTVSANLARSARATNVVHSGRASLHLVATSAGSTKASSIWQEIAPALNSATAYTLSYWYLPGASSNSLTIRLSGYGISVTNAFTPSTNRAPVLAPIADQRVVAGEAWRIQATATDPDLPPNALRFRFLGTVPEGMTLDAQSGWIAWTPSVAQAGASYPVAVEVYDDGKPVLSDSGSFTVTVAEPSRWRYVAATGIASSSTLYLYLTQPGDAYLDEVRLVAGDDPATGPNLLQNGDFEQSLTDSWTVSANHAGSARVTDVAHSGQASLHLEASSGGTTKASSIWQEISPTLTSGAQYSLSYWYLPGERSNSLVLRLSSSSLGSTNAIVPVSYPAPEILALVLETGAGPTLTWTTVPGARYQVQCASELSNPTWVNVGEPVDASATTATQTDLTASERQRFYRVVRLK